MPTSAAIADPITGVKLQTPLTHNSAIIDPTATEIIANAKIQATRDQAKGKADLDKMKLTEARRTEVSQAKEKSDKKLKEVKKEAEKKVQDAEKKLEEAEKKSKAAKPAPKAKA